MAEPAAPTTDARPFVRIVVLNWNAAWLTARCVRSLQQSTYPADRREIVVVDNASIDGSLQRLEADLHGVRFLPNPHNLGFAEGNNRAMRDLDDCDFVALVNNDAVVDPGWLEPLVDALRDDARAGAAAPKMLLETPFVSIAVVGAASIATVEIDGVDVTRRCIYHDVAERAHPTVPLAIDRTVTGAATIDVPVAARAGASSPSVTITWRAAPGAHLDVPDSDAVVSANAVTVSAAAAPTRRINSLGTALKPWTEGFERWFGELDRDHLATHETWGFSGGGVLLRAAMLRDVGVFDPRFFAYYEDTDLAWRARRRGWRVLCVPESVVHHLHGGSAGPEAQGFFFLNYRNWLVTVLRNGSPRQALRAFAVARRLSWPAFRRNVFGRVRRGKRPQAAITIAWARVAAGVALLAPGALRSRVRPGPVGAIATDHVVSRLMPSTPPRPPRPRPGGPLLCYVDVTETLRSGWRAGIQRVVCELFRTLPSADVDLELVPVCWSKVHRAFRRLDAAEYASLLAPTAAQQPASHPPAPSRLRTVLAAVMHQGGVAPLVYRYRRHRELAAVPIHHRQLMLERFEPGSVFLDLDASWNPTTQERSELLPQLRATGVETVLLLHDLLPATHPQWFIPQMVDVFLAHVDAHLRAGSTTLCNSEHTRSTLETYCTERGIAVPDCTVVPLGAVPPATSSPEPTRAQLPSPYFLVVGTVEPRKNHSVVLDAFDKLRADHPDARLVVAGRPGWNNDDIIERLRSGPTGVDWRTDVSDDELGELYAGATAVIVASVTEGFGLPVIEALQRGVPVVSSDGGALPEAGGDLVEYFDPTSASELHSVLLRHLDDVDHHDACRARIAAYSPTTWAESAQAVAAAIRREGGR